MYFQKRLLRYTKVNRSLRSQQERDRLYPLVHSSLGHVDDSEPPWSLQQHQPSTSASSSAIHHDQPADVNKGYFSKKLCSAKFSSSGERDELALPEEDEEEYSNREAKNTTCTKICAVQIDRTSVSSSSFESTDACVQSEKLDKQGGLSVSSSIQISFDLSDGRSRSAAGSTSSIFGEGRRISSLGESRSICGSSFFSRSAESYNLGGTGKSDSVIAKTIGGLNSSFPLGTNAQGSKKYKSGIREDSLEVASFHHEHGSVIEEEDSVKRKNHQGKKLG